MPSASSPELLCQYSKCSPVQLYLCHKHIYNCKNTSLQKANYTLQGCKIAESAISAASHNRKNRHLIHNLPGVARPSFLFYFCPNDGIDIITEWK